MRPFEVLQEYPELRDVLPVLEGTQPSGSADIEIAVLLPILRRHRNEDDGVAKVLLVLEILVATGDATHVTLSGPGANAN